MAQRSIREARGLFGPESVIWRVNREAVVALAGTCAILMQFAHPMVAAGVRDHSRFETDPVGRLRRTFDLTLTWVFGSRDQALEAARVVNRRHDTVNGPGYSAKDPAMLLWVQATLVYSAIRAYRAFVARLSDEDANRYYEDTKEIGVLLGLSRSMYPSDFEALNGYIEAMIDAGEVRVSADALRMGRIVQQPHFPGVPRMAFTPLRTITAGLLPPRLREQYDLAWRRPDRLLFKSCQAILPGFLRITPAPIRFLPPARQAYRRLRSQPA
ncbi:MAG: DUF2236 domain-containing protein [Chloroflexi bacterium]|nr:MAG: DUF2236 domain-containing protein [Chloroflexota bacterium]